MSDAIEFLASGGFTISVSLDDCPPVIRLEVSGTDGSANLTSAKMDTCAWHQPRARTHAVRVYQFAPVGKPTIYHAQYTATTGLEVYEKGHMVPLFVADTYAPVPMQHAKLTVTGSGVKTNSIKAAPLLRDPVCGWKLKKPWE